VPVIEGLGFDPLLVEGQGNVAELLSIRSGSTSDEREREILKQRRIDAVAMEAASGSRGEHIRERERSSAAKKMESCISAE
jgi:hypothetical protein